MQLEREKREIIFNVKRSHEIQEKIDQIISNSSEHPNSAPNIKQLCDKIQVLELVNELNKVDKKIQDIDKNMVTKKSQFRVSHSSNEKEDKFDQIKSALLSDYAQYFVQKQGIFIAKAQMSYTWLKHKQKNFD